MKAIGSITNSLIQPQAAQLKNAVQNSALFSDTLKSELKSLSILPGSPLKLVTSASGSQDNAVPGIASLPSQTGTDIVKPKPKPNDIITETLALLKHVLSGIANDSAVKSVTGSESSQNGSAQMINLDATTGLVIGKADQAGSALQSEKNKMQVLAYKSGQSSFGSGIVMGFKLPIG